MGRSKSGDFSAKKKSALQLALIYVNVRSARPGASRRGSLRSGLKKRNYEYFMIDLWLKRRL